MKKNVNVPKPHLILIIGSGKANSRAYYTKVFSINKPKPSCQFNPHPQSVSKRIFLCLREKQTGINKTIYFDEKLEVVAAILTHGDEILCVQRAESKFEYISKKFELTMHTFLCDVTTKDINLNEHIAST